MHGETAAAAAFARRLVKEQDAGNPLEPVIDDGGNPSLIITGSFSIDVRDFDIEGATGPEPEKYILLFVWNNYSCINVFPGLR